MSYAWLYFLFWFVVTISIAAGATCLFEAYAKKQRKRKIRKLLHREQGIGK